MLANMQQQAPQVPIEACSWRLKQQTQVIFDSRQQVLPGQHLQTGIYAGFVARL